MSTFPLDRVKRLRERLSNHPVYASVTNLEELSIFMQHHIYSVWDFMSLVKYLQHHIAPATVPWMPSQNTSIQRFINDIVLEEESDHDIPDESGHVTYTSHFRLYCKAMEEVKLGSTAKIEEFMRAVGFLSLDKAMDQVSIPQPALTFMKTTFDFLNSGKPHVVAAAFALGREHIIPQMFRALLEKMNIQREHAQVFHYYLDRHIELDGDHHGPMALELLDLMCENDPVKIAEAEEAALEAIEARIAFWDGVLLAFQSQSDSLANAS